MSGIYLLETSEQLDSALKEIVSDMKSSCTTAIEILNDLLTYEKLDSELLDVEKRPILISKIVNDQFKMFKISAQQLDVTLTLETHLMDDKQQILGDEHKLSQVFRNLFSNALKFTPAGGRVTVRLSDRRIYDKNVAQHFKLHCADAIESWVYVEVKDTGAGISIENQAKLFHEIIQFSPKELQNGQGSGLGLYISKGIVDLHGGLLGVSSVGEGCGTTFFVQLPAIRTEDIASVATTSDVGSAPIPKLGSLKEPASLRGKLVVLSSYWIHKS
jgi:signal transduction histidine kinase